MARALQDILTELNGVYQPQKDIYNQQIQNIDPQIQAEQNGLQQQKQDSFQQITDQANRRGMFYSGLPIAEEQKYTASQYLPAVANLHAKYAQQRFNLQDALAKVTQDQYSKAYGIRQNELDLEEKQREFDRQLAAQQAAARASAASGNGGGLDFSGLGNVLGASAGSATGKAVQKADGGFAFYDHNGNPISAAAYSSAAGIPFRTLLQNMAKSGDKGAQAALGFVGNDYGYNPNAIGSNGGLYNSLVWGTGRKFSGGNNLLSSYSGGGGLQGLNSPYKAGPTNGLQSLGSPTGSGSW